MMWTSGLAGTKSARGAIAIAAATLLVTGCSSSGSSDVDADNYPDGPVTFTVPSDPGGGWDTTIRALVQAAEQAQVLDSALPVQNRTGSAGCVWRTQMVNDMDGDAYNLSMDSTPVIAGILRGECDYSYKDVTLLTTVATERFVVVSNSNSDFQTLEDLLDAVVADPQGTAIAASGDDRLPFALVVSAYGGDPADINFVSYDGGGQQVTAVLNGDVAASVAGLSEFRGQIESGNLNGLVVLSDEELEAPMDSIPTSVSLGLDVTFSNTRAVYGPPNMPEAAVEYWQEKLVEILDSEEWEQIADQNQWERLVLVGDEAVNYFDEAEADIRKALIETGAIDE